MLEHAHNAKRHKTIGTSFDNDDKTTGLMLFSRSISAPKRMLFIESQLIALLRDVKLRIEFYFIIRQRLLTRSALGQHSGLSH